VPANAQPGSADLTELWQQQERLLNLVTPPPEVLTRLSEKSAELAQAAERGEKEAQRRLQREVRELAAQIRPSAEALKQLQKNSRLYAQQAQELAQLSSSMAIPDRHALQEQIAEAMERAQQEVRRSLADGFPHGAVAAPLAQERAMLQKERARLEQERARLEQERARLNTELQRHKAERSPSLPRSRQEPQASQDDDAQ
jgi:hypothetical protein